jgi:hypothetical protein
MPGGRVEASIFGLQVDSRRQVWGGLPSVSL